MEGKELELEKSIDTFIDKFLADDLKKAKDSDKGIEEDFDEIKSDDAAKKEHLNANGYGDVIKGGYGKAKDKEEEKEAAEEEKEAAEESKEKAKKKNEMKEKKEMKKSFEINEDDYELLQKAKIERNNLNAKKEQETLRKSITDVVTEQLAPLQTKIDEIMKALNRPAAPRKSVTKANVIEKSFQTGNSSEPLTKSQTLDVMEELALKGKISPNTVMEYEITGKMSNPNDYRTVQQFLSERNN